MIIDIHQKFDILNVSYVDKEGNIKLKNIKLDKNNRYNWDIYKENSKAIKSNKYKNWDGRPIKKTKTKFLNKWSIFDVINYKIPEKDREDIFAHNIPKIQSIDIETEVIDGFPDVNVAFEQITVISISYENNKTYVLGTKEIDKKTEKRIYDNFNKYLKDFGEWEFKYIKFNSEYHMLDTFISKIMPTFSIMTGWNVIDFDWSYIYTRCKRIGVNVENCSPTKSIKYRSNIPDHVAIIDYLELYKKYDISVKVKERNTLDFVSNAILGVNKLEYQGTLQELYEQDYDKYVLYNAIDSALVMLIHKKTQLTSIMYSMALLYKIPISDVLSPIRLTEASLWRGYSERNKKIASKSEIPKRPYEGAFVKEPEKGIHYNIVGFDFSSLYPTIMRQFNISPETYVLQSNDENILDKYRNDNNYIVTHSGSVYKNDKDSVTKNILGNLYSERKLYKNIHLTIDRLLSQRKK